MDTLVLQPTSTAQWHALVSEAASAAQTRLDEDLESYLVFLLMRFTSEPKIAARLLAVEYLEGVLAMGRRRHERLRDVGDLCLLYSGLFPQIAARRRVRVSYYVDLGRAAYHELGQRVEDARARFYLGLARAFVSLMDVLQAMRALRNRPPGLRPLEAFELWEDTQSTGALRALNAVTTALPAPGGRSRSH